MLPKKAYDREDKATLLRSLINRLSLPITLTDDEANDMWSFVMANAKKRWTPPSSAMNSSDWNDMLDSRLGMYLNGINFRLNQDAGQNASSWENDEPFQDDFLGRNVSDATSVADLQNKLTTFMVSRAGDMQRAYTAQKKRERSDSEIGRDENQRGVTERSYQSPRQRGNQPAGMGGRETAREFPFEKWQDYSALSSQNPLVGQAVQEIQEAWQELVEDYLADFVINAVYDADQSTHSLAEEKVIFYGGYNLDVNVQGATTNPSDLGVGGRNPLFDQKSIAWYLVFRALRAAGVRSASELGWKKGRTIGLLTESKEYKNYGKVMDLALTTRGTGLSWDQTTNPSPRLRATANVVLDEEKGGYVDSSTIRPLLQLISKRLSQGGSYEKAIYAATEIQFTFDENLSYEDWLPANFKQNFPALTSKFVAAFEKLDIGLAAYAQQRRFAKKNQKLITRVAYKYILQNGGKESAIERIASTYMDKKAGATVQFFVRSSWEWNYILSDGTMGVGEADALIDSIQKDKGMTKDEVLKYIKTGKEIPISDRLFKSLKSWARGY